jgi:23S rRNA (pseudouridine1915-N3)-methyltransferase
MKFRFYLIGKAKEKYFLAAYEEYLKRLSKYGEVSLNYISEALLPSAPSDSQIQMGLKDEAQRALKQVKEQDYLILIDLHGKEMTSEEFASLLKEAEIHGKSSFVFIVGSSYGLDDSLRKRADFALCFSKMTTTHPLALLLTLEQVYRAEKINSGENYHK